MVDHDHHAILMYLNTCNHGIDYTLHRLSAMYTKALQCKVLLHVQCAGQNIAKSACTAMQSVLLHHSYGLIGSRGRCTHYVFH